MTNPGFPPRQNMDPVKRMRHLEKGVEELGRRAMIPTTADRMLFGDVLSTAPRFLINQGLGASLSVNVPRGVLLYAVQAMTGLTSITFFVQNSSVSSATVAGAVFASTKIGSLTLVGSGSVGVTASTTAVYQVPLTNITVPAGFAFVVLSATAVGATTPVLATSGSTPVQLLTGSSGQNTSVVGSTTMTPWPAMTSLDVGNTAVWTASQTPIWVALS